MKAVIFDRDGVIVDSESINIDSAIQAFRIVGISIKEEEKEQMVGRHPDDYIEYFLDRYNFSYEDFGPIQVNSYYKLLESVPVFKDVVSLIKSLHQDHIPLGLTTSSPLDSTLRVLQIAELENVFDVVVTCEDYKKRKPDPESYLLTATKLEVEPQECVVIEDSQVGVTAAIKAGMKCIALPNSFTKHQDFSQADVIVNDVSRIDIAFLKRL